MNFIKEYLKIVSYSFLGLIFAFASFYLLANLYHYFELQKSFSTDFSKQTVIMNIDDSLSKIRSNINGYNPNTYSGNMSTIKIVFQEKGKNNVIVNGKPKMPFSELVQLYYKKICNKSKIYISSPIIKLNEAHFNEALIFNLQGEIYYGKDKSEGNRDL